MAFIENSSKQEAIDTLHSLHFDVFNAMEAIGDNRRRGFQKYLKGLRIIERAIEHLNGHVFRGFPLNCGLDK